MVCRIESMRETRPIIFFVPFYTYISFKQLGFALSGDTTQKLQRHKDRDTTHDCNNTKVVIQRTIVTKQRSWYNTWLLRHKGRDTTHDCNNTKVVIHIQSFLAAGAVWLNLGPPRQPEGCRGGPRCSQTAPAARRDCVYHYGTDTRLEQVKLEKIELEKKAF